MSISSYFSSVSVGRNHGSGELTASSIGLYLAGISDTFNQFSSRKRQLLAAHGRHRITSGPEGPLNNLGML